MSENKKIILIQPNASLLDRAVDVLQQAGLEVAAFDDVKDAFVALNGDFGALVLGFGTQWADETALLKAVNTRAKAIAWLAEPVEKVENGLKDAGIGVIFGTDALLDTLNALKDKKDTVIVPENGFTGYMLIKATDGMTAPTVFNALRGECAGIWALKDEGWHMVVMVKGADQAEVNARLDALVKTPGIENTWKLLNTVKTGALDVALLNARKETVKTISFAFARVKFLEKENATTMLALCPGVTAVAMDNKTALVQLAGVSLTMIQEAVSQGIYALPMVLGVELFAGLNILEVE